MRFSLPATPEPAPPTPFPLLGVLAPLLVTGGIWALTRSPFALIFALLSPVIAVASVVDSRLQARRRARIAAAAERVALAELATAIGERLHQDRARRFVRTPPAGNIVTGGAPGAALWRAPAADGRPIVLGLGRQPSDVVLDGRPVTPPARKLADRAAVLEAVPVCVDALLGVGVCGPPALARALLRGLVLQLLFAAPPGALAVHRRPGDGWEWLAAAPHAIEDDGADRDDRGKRGDRAERGGREDASRVSAPPMAELVLADGEREVLLAYAPAASELPAGCGTVVVVSGTAAARVVAGSPSVAEGDQAIEPELIAAAQAAAVARALAAHPRALNAASGGTLLPPVVGLGDLLPEERGPGGAAPGSRDDRGAAAARRPDRLAAPIGVREGGGPLVLDLVADGPHAVVGGTTGSGKSELLVTWVCSLAATHDPAEVTFLLVDFKGGSAFDPLAALPHCVGLLTDLGPREAERALASLRAEVRQRERLLREAGARDIASCPAGSAPPRLVVVVDEFAAMLTDFPDLHDLFVDLAARGRSLGVHLVLCTQRPSGSVRDALLANCNLRLSLRVNSRADSTALLGSDAAAALPAAPVGRCVVRTGGGDPQLCQVATAGPDPRGVIARVSAGEWGTGPAPQRRPWLEPLPSVLGVRELEDPTVQREDVPGAIVFGLLDVPEQQARRYAAWHPVEHGPLLVLGAARSGKTGVLAALSRASGPGRPLRIVSADPVQAWDAVGAALEQVRAPGGGAGGDATDAHLPGHGARFVLAVDDVDVLLGRLGAEYGAELLDRLAALLREGAAAGCSLVLTAQRLSGAIAPLAALAGRVLLLRAASRQEHVLAGGDAQRYDPDLPPGGGWWQGHRAQVARVPPVPPAEPEAPRRVRLRPGRAYAVVSTRPAETARRLAAAANGPPILVTSLGVDPVGADDAGTARRGASGAATGGDDAIPVLLGDPEEWQAQWGVLQSARRSRCMIYDGCTPRDVRALGRPRGLPPLLGDARSVWFAEPGGEVQRRAWPD
ncbi:FtsK/SpoIIIE domain-containing protein [Planctomonas deserti]|uniref:FtsK/SpoIIIE domain-containing protein n=1 Tax=Planctomonas deserti TaxID=2144185 RepID=UPI000D34F202|nr:FtsK/SpoIIIE domain-containing protein [Planctomonas deserti]